MKQVGTSVYTKTDMKSRVLCVQDYGMRAPRRRSNEKMVWRIPTRSDRALHAEVEQIQPRHCADLGAHLRYITP